MATASPAETPVLDTLTAMTAESIARSGLDAAQLLSARLAALAAVQAPPASYLMHIGPAIDAGVTLEDVQHTLVAVAPIIGTSRTLEAAMNITEALGVAVTALAAEIESGLNGDGASADA
jgi:alkylhydroperoxidase/carboxymuconolactone decarboxylase family protein YurZ